MDIVNKAIAKASDLASEAGWNAQQRIKVSTEERRLDDTRAKAEAKRAEIGEAMFRLWQAHKLPPSGLDGLFYELQDLTDATFAASQNLDALRSETYTQVTTAQAQTVTSYAAAVPTLPAPLAGAGDGSALALPSGARGSMVIDSTPAVPLVDCPSCHSVVRADRNFCGRCGTRLR